MNTIVIDLDDTITVAGVSEYIDAPVREDVVEQLRNYREKGFKITILTARNMRTYEGDLDKIKQFTLPIIIEWLAKNDVPYDDIVVGKPWCGNEGFYIDDKAIRPNEFTTLTHEQICRLVNHGKSTDIGQV
jgi:capsule biosynthesis phosphatase